MGRVRQLAREAYRTAVERSPLGRRIRWRGEPGGVALTFDDGPDPEFTPQVLDVLRRYGARATFFLVGQRADRHPELVRRIAAEGHAIGNHTYSHVHCRELELPALIRQLERTDAALERALGGLPDSLPPFRPPFGELRPLQALYLAAAGRTLVFWNQDVCDYRGAPASDIAAVGPKLSPGDVVLLHDRFPATVQALPRLLEELNTRGLAPLPLRAEPLRHGQRRPAPAGRARA
jgi:peptidoglycan/xylan/chitin deacetylase (PgdA/CDA1 family)